MAFKGDLDALILGVLQNQKAHGYEIAKQISKKTNKLVTVGEGKLYPALHKEWEPQQGKPSKRIYSISDKGVAELAAKRTLWSQLSEGIDSILTATRKEDRKHA